MKLITYKILITLLALFILFACNDKKNEPKVFNGKEFNRLVNGYLNGDSASTAITGFLFNNADANLIKVNELLIDSISISADTKFYYLILEAQNPAYNLYTVIDNKMNVHLKDNSLNGHLNSQIQNIDGKRIHIIEESFTSQDTFKVQRTSFYDFTNSTVSLIFRTITAFNFGNSTITASVETFNDQKILIDFNNFNSPSFDLKEDEFIFDATTKKYISENNFLRNYALEQINKYKSRKTLNDITDKSSFEKIFYGADNNKVSTAIFNTDYSIFLTDDWKEFENFSISKYLKKEFKGNRYVNQKLGASISIIKLPERDSAEVYIDLELSEKKNLSNAVQFGTLAETGKLNVSFYEYSCGEKKILLIFESPKYTYELNSNTYEEIINTFKINC